MNSSIKKMAVAALVVMMLSSCGVTKNLPIRQEQATLTCYIREADNKAILKLVTVTGKEVIYYDKKRGTGQARWREGDKYTVEFDAHHKVVDIKINQ